MKPSEFLSSFALKFVDWFQLAFTSLLALRLLFVTTKKGTNVPDWCNNIERESKKNLCKKNWLKTYQWFCWKKSCDGYYMSFCLHVTPFIVDKKSCCMTQMIPAASLAHFAKSPKEEKIVQENCMPAQNCSCARIFRSVGPPQMSGMYKLQEKLVRPRKSWLGLLTQRGLLTQSLLDWVARMICLCLQNTHTRTILPEEKRKESVWFRLDINQLKSTTSSFGGFSWQLSELVWR